MYSSIVKIGRSSKRFCVNKNLHQKTKHPIDNWGVFLYIIEKTKEVQNEENLFNCYVVRTFGIRRRNVCGYIQD